MRNIVFGMLLSCLSAQSYAAERGLYAELLLGNAEQEISYHENSVSGSSFSMGFRGGFAFNNNLAVEAEYQNFGEAHGREPYPDVGYSDFGLDTSAALLGLRGRLPLGKGFSLHARIGVAFWDMDLEQRDSGSTDHVSFARADGDDVFYSTGAQMMLGERAYFGLEYSTIEMKVPVNGFTNDYELSNLAAFVGYKF